MSSGARYLSYSTSSIRQQSFQPCFQNKFLAFHPEPHSHLPPPTKADQRYWQSSSHQHALGSKMAQMNSAEMEEFQNLSDRYQAELPGPLVGDKLSMAALVTEYAQADPAFVVKTTALAHTHSAYRPIKGDGQCGWRGVVFSYFELLLQMGDMSLLQQENIRLRSFEDTMRMAGIDYDIVIDMFDSTWELLEEIRKAIERQDKNDRVVLDFMNDETRSNFIVYHFKMMTSAYMQMRPDQYEPFLEMSIYEYRVARIDPSNQEIDQIGLQALTDAVISPAGFALEVLYLDRSEGEEVTPYPFSQIGSNAPTIRLLYRPGHYDIVYRDSRQSLQVFLQNQQSIPQEMHPAYNPNVVTDFHSYLSPHSSESRGDQPFNLVNWMPHTSSHSTQHQYSYSYDGSSYIPSQQHFSPPISNSMPGPIQYQPVPAQFSSPQPTTTSPSPVSVHPPSSSGPQIRLTAYTKNFDRQPHESIPIDSGYQSAAALSQNHFRNQDFQPQMWNADDEYLTKP